MPEGDGRMMEIPRLKLLDFWFAYPWAEWMAAEAEGFDYSRCFVLL
jgi:hypothetical protein